MTILIWIPHPLSEMAYLRFQKEEQQRASNVMAMAFVLIATGIAFVMAVGAAFVTEPGIAMRVAALVQLKSWNWMGKIIQCVPLVTEMEPVEFAMEPEELCNSIPH